MSVAVTISLAEDVGVTLETDADYVPDVATDLCNRALVLAVNLHANVFGDGEAAPASAEATE